MAILARDELPTTRNKMNGIARHSTRIAVGVGDENEMAGKVGLS